MFMSIPSLIVSMPDIAIAAPRVAFEKIGLTMVFAKSSSLTSRPFVESVSIQSTGT